MTYGGTAGSSARESILSSIRQSLAASADHCGSHFQHTAAVDSSLPQPDKSVSIDGLIEQFKRNLESVGGHCYIAADKSEATAALSATIANLKASKIAISNSPLVGLIVNEISDFEFVKNADRDLLFVSDLGITSAQWGIAETGTLVLESDKESHRLTSLVPPVHICIFEIDKLRKTLGEVLGSLEVHRSRAVTFITGASRTSDIELTLAIGVHGPRELHVILIRDHQS